MIIDSFCFFNEFDVLEIRLKELWDVVDWFVIVEASKTQSLEDKPYYYDENKERFKPYLSKIAHVKIHTYPPTQDKNNLWEMENFQRNQVWQGIKRLPNISAQDILMVSDCDEIPSSTSVREAIDKINSGEENRVVFKHLNNAFALNLNYSAEPSMLGTFMVKVLELAELAPQTLRDLRSTFTIQHGGWHFSYMGGKEQVYKKFFACIEPFDKNVIPSFEQFSKDFDRKIKDGGSFLFSDKNDDSRKLEKIHIAHLPECVISGGFGHLLI